MDELTIIATSLERISDKLDKHDDKFDAIAENLKQLTRLDMKLINTEESINRAFTEIDILKKTHSENGCHVAIEMKKEINTLKEKVETIEKKPLARFDIITKGFLTAMGVSIWTWIVVQFSTKAH